MSSVAKWGVEYVKRRLSKLIKRLLLSERTRALAIVAFIYNKDVGFFNNLSRKLDIRYKLDIIERRELDITFKR